jgi:hypothetical protein
LAVKQPFLGRGTDAMAARQSSCARNSSGESMRSVFEAAAADCGFLSAANDAGDGMVAAANNTKINPSLRTFLEISEDLKRNPLYKY